jgi:hypothetical protein
MMGDVGSFPLAHNSIAWSMLHLSLLLSAVKHVSGDIAHCKYAWIVQEWSENDKITARYGKSHWYGLLREEGGSISLQ